VLIRIASENEDILSVVGDTTADVSINIREQKQIAEKTPPSVAFFDDLAVVGSLLSTKRSLLKIN
jgi:hypothetical protein